MQTRKKSISLHALGIIPTARVTRRSASSSSANNTPTTDTHPAKRLKRSHTLTNAAPSSTNLASPSSPSQRRRNVSAAGDKQQRPQPTSQTTPPPSPDDHRPGKIDTAGINDDVVVAVVEQLESTGNRPHQIKELATVLAGNLRVVDSSSNPVAIISSRLTNYLRRPWTALGPCPLAKEQVNIHPRRVYYFLTTCRRQPIPEVADQLLGPSRIISPSVSSGPDEEDVENANTFPQRKREALSPSPEIDLSSPDLDMSGLNYSDAAHPPYSTTHASQQDYNDSRRAASPALEHDEREFTHTASVMATRAQSSQVATPAASGSSPDDGNDHQSPEPFLSMDAPVAETPEPIVEDPEEESDELLAQRNHEAATALFGHGGGGGRLGGIMSSAGPGFSSPLLKPHRPGKEALTVNTDTTSTSRRLAEPVDEEYSLHGEFGAWGDLKSPETVGLKELDDLLGDF